MKSEELKKIRKNLGLSQKDFAAFLGFSREKYSMLELGKKPIDKADVLLINSKYKSVNNTHSGIATGNGEQILDYKNNFKSLSQAADSMAIMTNTSTSLVSLDLICEVLSVVSARPLEEIKAQASSMLKERGAKLQVVLDSLF